MSTKTLLSLGSTSSGPSANASPGFHFTKEKPSRTNCLIKTVEDKWHELIKSLDSEEEREISDYWIPKIEKYAQLALELEVSNYKKLRAKQASSDKSSSDHSEAKWIDTVLRSGALADKISAYTVLLQESPVHNLSALETLIEMVCLKSRRPCMLALDALKDLFVSGLLPEDRHLVTFGEQPFYQLHNLPNGSKDLRDKHLILWLFEHKLKELYGKFLKQMDEIAKDKIEKTKIKAMSIFLELLITNPEQEQELLSRLVNKLGDPVKNIAAKAMYQLGKLLEEHPNMKMIVLKEVERILYRPNVNIKAQYYGICFLSQMLLEQDESPLANKLIQIYLGFFKACVKKGDIDSKLMSALLTGVNRAYPYADMGQRQLEEQVQVMFKVVNLSSFNVSVQALMILYQLLDSDVSGMTADRFYTTLYKKIVDPNFASSTKHAVFLNLTFKAMKKDTFPERVRAYIKRLLQVCTVLPPNLICGCLYLISEVFRARADLGSLVKRSADVKSEASKERAEKIDEAVLAKFEDDEDEHYEDVKDDEDDEMDDSSENDESNSPSEENATRNKSSWLHHQDSKQKKNYRGNGAFGYDPLQRNPLYCGAETSPLWELQELVKHFHPSVVLFAQNLLDGVSIKYSGDPLLDFTTMRFLDRFVFRNPKKDPLKSKPSSVLGKRSGYLPKGIKAIAPDSREFSGRSEESIPTDEKFLWRYFAEKRKYEAVEQDSDAESVTSEDFNALLDKISGGGVDKDIDLDVVAGLDDDMEGLSEDDEANAESSSDNDMSVDEERSSGSESKLDGEDSDPEDDDKWEDIEDMESDHDNQEEEFDEEAYVNSENDEEEQGTLVKPVNQKSKRSKKAQKSSDLQSLLASAEEFTHLIEQDTTDALNIGGSEAVGAALMEGKPRNKKTAKNAGVQQLQWERNRNDDWKARKRNKGKKHLSGFKKRSQKKS